MEFYNYFFVMLIPLCQCDSQYKKNNHTQPKQKIHYFNWRFQTKSNTLKLNPDTVNCSKEDFINHYVDRGIYISPDKMRRIFRNCSSIQNVTCEKAKIELYFHTANHTNGTELLYVYRWYKFQPGCWGHFAQMKYGNKTNFAYLNFHDKKFMFQSIISPLPITNYEAKIISIPSMQVAKLSRTSPGECEQQTLESVHLHYQMELDKTKSCNRDEEVQQKEYVSEILCATYPNSPEKRQNLLNTVHMENCRLTFPKKTKTKQNNVNIIIIIIAISLGLLLTLLLYVTLVRSKREAFKCLKKKLYKDDKIYLMEPRKKATSVLILYPPGCMQLHRMLRDVASIISSYDIKVHLALLESTKIDSKGGIAKFYEEHIISSTYTLVLCTDSQGQSVHHKPYRFALRIISGQAFHNNDSSPYIPIYIGTFENNRHHIPAFLLDENKRGYGLPHDLESLLSFFLVNEDIKLSSEIQNRNNIYIKCIKNLSKSYHEDGHSNCNKKECTKGVQTSASFASSIFASMKTIDEDRVDLLNFPMENTIFLDRSHSLDNLF